jgi:hypothetical protein
MKSPASLMGTFSRIPWRRILKVTTVFRREGGEWKIIHLHGDALPDGDSGSTRLQLGRLDQTGGRPDRVD